MKSSLLVIIICAFKFTIAQTPATDSNWTIDNVYSDEFSGSVVNTSKWKLQKYGYEFQRDTIHGDHYNISYAYPYNDGYCHFADSSTGTLTLKVRDTTYIGDIVLIDSGWIPSVDTFDYIDGGLLGKHDFKYGYFEIRFKLPVGNCGNFGPNFWFNGNLGDTVESEIDVFESNTRQYGIDNYTASNIHIRGPDIPGHVDTAWHYRKASLTTTIPHDRGLDDSWHTYAVSWTPEKVVVYFDGIQTISSYEFPSYLYPMHTIIDINSPTANFGNFDFGTSAVFPYNYQIDYFRVYKLKSQCSDTATYTSGDLHALHNHHVKNTIIVGVNGNTSTAYVHSGGNVSLRATGEISLLDGFEVDAESEFFAENTTWCP